MPKKKSGNNKKVNISILKKDFDVYRNALQYMYVYGCYKNDIIAEKSGYNKEKMKSDYKNLYSGILAEHIGKNYMIEAGRRGRSAKASYLCYHRFTRNENFLFPTYLCSTITPLHMCYYFLVRQAINEYKNNPDDLNNALNELFMEELNSKTYFSGFFEKYFGVCKKMGYETVYDFILKFADSDIWNFINKLSDAISLFSVKSPYAMPAYTIMRKIRESYNTEIGGGDDNFSDYSPDSWDVTYGHYDTILYDDSVYKILHAIWNNRLISYTKQYGNEKRIFVIPLKIMREFNSGRTYLFYSKKDTNKISSIRIDKMFEVAVYIPEENDIKHINNLKEIFNESSKDIWLSADYTVKDKPRTVTLKVTNLEALDYIQKYAPYYEYDKKTHTVTVTVRKADDIKPFIRYLGSRAIISKHDSPKIYEEFKNDYSEKNNVYLNSQIAENYETNKRLVLHTIISDEHKAENIITDKINKPADAGITNEENTEYNPDNNVLSLYNRFNSIHNIVLDDIYKDMFNEETTGSQNNEIRNYITQTFSNIGFATKGQFTNKYVNNFTNVLKTLQESSENHPQIKDYFFMEKNNDDTVSKITDECCSPAQIFTDYEYEYLYLMLKDKEVRSLLPKDAADKMEEALSQHFTNISLNDVYITRFTNQKTQINYSALSKNMGIISQAIHDHRKIKYTYKNTEVSGSPYRFSYSLRERIPRLFIVLDTDERIIKVNIDKMENVKIEKNNVALKDADFEKLLSKNKKYIEIVIKKDNTSIEKNVFERALRLFSSYEKYTWDDIENKEYVIAVVYYDFDVIVRTTKNKENSDIIKKVYRMDTIVGDILSLGKYARVLEESRFKIPEKQSPEYDTDMYYFIRGIYKNLNELYN